jgi:hypothetical protein
MNHKLIMMNDIECRNAPQCKTYKHEYDECVERVTGQIEEHGKAKEDCVEECKFEFNQSQHQY